MANTVQLKLAMDDAWDPQGANLALLKEAATGGNSDVTVFDYIAKDGQISDVLKLVNLLQASHLSAGDEEIDNSDPDSFVLTQDQEDKLALALIERARDILMSGNNEVQHIIRLVECLARIDGVSLTDSRGRQVGLYNMLTDERHQVEAIEAMINGEMSVNPDAKTSNPFLMRVARGLDIDPTLPSLAEALLRKVDPDLFLPRDKKASEPSPP